jgi:MFS family permease
MSGRSEREQDAGPDVARRRTRRWVASVLLGSLVLAAGGAVLGFVVGARHHRPGHHISWGALIAVVTVCAAVLAATGLVLWKLLNRPAYQRVMQYHWRRRMRVAKALRRGDPISPEDLDVADAVVGVMRKDRLMFWYAPVLITSFILIAFMRHGAIRWLYASYGLVTAPALVYAVRVRRRTIRNWDALSNSSVGDPQDTDDR